MQRELLTANLRGRSAGEEAETEAEAAGREIHATYRGRGGRRPYLATYVENAYRSDRVMTGRQGV